MQTNTVIYPPNRPLDRIITEPQTPVLEDYLFFINCNSRGEAIFSSSDVSGTGWYGCVFYCNDLSDAVQLKYSSYYNTNSTIGDGAFYKDDFIIVTTDNKFLTLLSIDKEHNKLVEQFAIENPDITDEIALWPKSSKFVTTLGKSVGVWNLEDDAEMRLVQEYRDYHGEAIKSVDTDKTQENVFFTASVDKKACIWDTRLQMPAKVIYSNEFCALRTISCHPNSSNNVVVGTTAGDLYLIDIREPNEFVSVYSCFKSGIYRTAFNESAQLAVCGDTNSVLVVTCEGNNLKGLYSNSDHDGVVRGLTWHKESLYTCGFDRKIVKHTI